MFDLLKVEFPGETSLTKMGIIATLEDDQNAVVRVMSKGHQYLPLLFPSRLWSNEMNLYETEEEGEMTRQEMVAFFEKMVAATLPRRWPATMVATWIESLVVLTPDEKRRLNRPQHGNSFFTGVSLVGGNNKKESQPLTEDDVHKATGVIPYLTTA